MDKQETQITEQSRLIQELIRRLTCEDCGNALDEGPGPECFDGHPAFEATIAKSTRVAFGLH